MNQKIEYTYLIYDGRYYKIGKSRNPRQRLQSLLTANPRCKLLGYGTGRTEQQLHEIFADCRVNREWFDLAPKQVKLISRLLSGTETGIDLKDCSLLRSHAKREKARNTFVIKFGKYKGRKLSTMIEPEELKYLEWVLTWENIERDYPVLCRNISDHFDTINDAIDDLLRSKNRRIVKGRILYENSVWTNRVKLNK